MAHITTVYDLDLLEAHGDQNNFFFAINIPGVWWEEGSPDAFLAELNLDAFLPWKWNRPHEVRLFVSEDGGATWASLNNVALREPWIDVDLEADAANLTTDFYEPNLKSIALDDDGNLIPREVSWRLDSAKVESGGPAAIDQSGFLRDYIGRCAQGLPPLNHFINLALTFTVTRNSLKEALGLNDPADELPEQLDLCAFPKMGSGGSFPWGEPQDPNALGDFAAVESTYAGGIAITLTDPQPPQIETVGMRGVQKVLNFQPNAGNNENPDGVIDLGDQTIDISSTDNVGNNWLVTIKQEAGSLFELAQTIVDFVGDETLAFSNPDPQGADLMGVIAKLRHHDRINGTTELRDFLARVIDAVAAFSRDSVHVGYSSLPGADSLVLRVADALGSGSVEAQKLANALTVLLKNEEQSLTNASDWLGEVATILQPAPDGVLAIQKLVSSANDGTLPVDEAGTADVLRQLDTFLAQTFGEDAARTLVAGQWEQWIVDDVNVDGVIYAVDDIIRQVRTVLSEMDMPTDYIRISNLTRKNRGASSSWWKGIFRLDSSAKDQWEEIFENIEEELYAGAQSLWNERFQSSVPEGFYPSYDTTAGAFLEFSDAGVSGEITTAFSNFISRRVERRKNVVFQDRQGGAQRKTFQNVHDITLQVDKFAAETSGADLLENISGAVILARRHLSEQDPQTPWSVLTAGFPNLLLRSDATVTTLELRSALMVPLPLPYVDDTRGSLVSYSGRSLVAKHEDERTIEMTEDPGNGESSLGVVGFSLQRPDKEDVIPKPPAFVYGKKYDFAAYVLLNSGALPVVLRDPNDGHPFKPLPDLGSLEIADSDPSLFHKEDYLRRVMVNALRVSSATGDIGQGNLELPDAPAGITPLAHELPAWRDADGEPSLLFLKNPAFQETQLFLDSFSLSLGCPQTTYENWLAWVAAEDPPLYGVDFDPQQPLPDGYEERFRIMAIRRCLADQQKDGPALDDPAVLARVKVILTRMDWGDADRDATFDQTEEIEYPEGDGPYTKGGIAMNLSVVGPKEPAALSSNNGIEIALPEGQVWRVEVFSLVNPQEFEAQGRFEPFIQNQYGTANGTTIQFLGFSLWVETVTNMMPSQRALYSAMNATDDGRAIRLDVDRSILDEPDPLEPDKLLERMKYVSRLEVQHQVWRWNGRPVRAQALPFNGSDPLLADAELFSDRPDRDHAVHPARITAYDLHASNNAGEIRQKDTTVFTHDWSEIPRGTYHRLSVQAYSRYEPAIDDAVQAEIQNEGVGKPWTQHYFPARISTRLEKPILRTIIPLTSTGDTNSTDLPGVMCVLDETWFDQAGLAERLEVEIELVKYKAGSAGEPESHYLNAGHDQIISTTALQAWSLGKEVKKAATLPDHCVNGPFGHTFDRDVRDPKLIASSFHLKIPTDWNDSTTGVAIKKLADGLGEYGFLYKFTRIPGLPVVEGTQPPDSHWYFAIGTNPTLGWVAGDLLPLTEDQEDALEEISAADDPPQVELISIEEYTAAIDHQPDGDENALRRGHIVVLVSWRVVAGEIETVVERVVNLSTDAVSLVPEFNPETEGAKTIQSGQASLDAGDWFMAKLRFRRCLAAGGALLNDSKLLEYSSDWSAPVWTQFLPPKETLLPKEWLSPDPTVAERLSLRQSNQPGEWILSPWSETTIGAEHPTRESDGKALFQHWLLITREVLDASSHTGEEYIATFVREPGDEKTSIFRIAAHDEEPVASVLGKQGKANFRLRVMEMRINPNSHPEATVAQLSWQMVFGTQKEWDAEVREDAGATVTRISDPVVVDLS